jgi:hypothetical protein
LGIFAGVAEEEDMAHLQKILAQNEEPAPDFSVM